MAILALATSGPAGAVGLRLPDGGLRSLALASGARRGRGVAPAIRSLLAQAGVALDDLRAIAVDVGPGSFTGVRVGVTTAKSLAFALAIPVLPVGSLTALAADADPDEVVMPIRDAGRGTVYHAVFEPGAPGARPTRVHPGRAPGETLATLAPDARPIGEDAPALAERFGLSGDAQAVTADVHAVLAVAEARLARGETVAAHDLVPRYHQASAPERKAAGEVD